MKKKLIIIISGLVLFLAVSITAGVAYAQMNAPKHPSDYHIGIPYEQAVKSDKPMLILFYADWCGYCTKQQEVLNDLSNNNFWIGKVDCDKNPAIAKKYGVTGLPTMILFKNGKIATQLTGYHDKSQLLNKLTMHLS